MSGAVRRLGLAAAAGLALFGAAGTSSLEARRAAPAALPAFTPQEAAAGAQVYAGACAMCHGKALEGTYEVPPLTGRFVGNWSNAPVRDLHGYLRRAMPLFAPGSLGEQDATNLVAYLLHANGLVVRPAPAAMGKGGDPRLDGVIAPGAARSR